MEHFKYPVEGWPVMLNKSVSPGKPSDPSSHEWFHGDIDKDQATEL